MVCQTPLKTSILSNSPQDFIAFYSTPLNFQAQGSGSVFTLNGHVPDSAKYVEGIITFRYVDKNEITGVETPRSFDWTFSKFTVINPGNFALSTLQSEFYPAFYAGIGTAPANTARYIDSTNITVWAATSDFVNYLSYNNATGGITADQIKPTFTNIRGKDVYGLFTSRAKIFKNGLEIGAASIDSLVKKADPSLRLVGAYMH